MPLNQPFPELDELLASMGEGGRRIAAIDAGEGAAGNISIRIGWPIEVRRRFPHAEPVEAAARYEYMDVVAAGRAQGLAREEARTIVEAFGVNTTLFV